MTIPPRHRAKFPWLDRLGAADRAAAARWLNEPGGEVRLRRIAAAIMAPNRGRGAPAKDYEWLIRRAAEAWLATPGINQSKAAAIAGGALSNSDVTPERLRRIAREGLEAAPAGLMVEAEAALRSRGVPIRQDWAVARIGAWLQRLGEPYVTDLPTWLVGPSLAASRKVEATGERLKCIACFIEAFPNLFPPETPISRIAPVYDLIRAALRGGGE